MPYIVTEKIHHGDFHNERSAEVESRAEFQKFLEGSPYKPSDPLIVSANVWPHLLASGRYYHGWAEFTLTTTED